MHSRRPTANHRFDTVGEDGVAKGMLAAKIAESERLKGSQIVRSTLMMDFMRDLFAAMPGMGGR